MKFWYVLAAALVGLRAAQLSASNLTVPLGSLAAAMKPLLHAAIELTIVDALECITMLRGPVAVRGHEDSSSPSTPMVR